MVKIYTNDKMYLIEILSRNGIKWHLEKSNYFISTIFFFFFYIFGFTSYLQYRYKKYNVSQVKKKKTDVIVMNDLFVYGFLSVNLLHVRFFSYMKSSWAEMFKSVFSNTVVFSTYILCCSHSKGIPNLLALL